MLFENCWQHKRCGHGPGAEAEKGQGCGICPAATHKNADGFLGGENGGRACFFIHGTYCAGQGKLSAEEKKELCLECDFYKYLKDKYSKAFTAKIFERYVINSKNRVFIY